MRTRLACGVIALAAVGAVGGFSPAPSSGQVRFSDASEAHCYVPRTLGVSLAAAEKKIRLAHCRVGVVRRRASALLRENHVLHQKPAWGRSKPAGSKVLLVVGNGPKTGRLPRLGALVSSRLPPFIAYDPPAGGIWL